MTCPPARPCGTLVFAAALLPSVGLHAAERRVPSLPPAGQQIRLIVDTDAACEIDDLYAIALSVFAPERFDIEGFVAAHFGDASGPDGIEKSFRLVNTVLDKAGLAGKFAYVAVPTRFVTVRFPSRPKVWTSSSNVP